MRKPPSKSRSRLSASPDSIASFAAEDFTAGIFMGVPPYVLAAEQQMEGWNPKKKDTIFLRNRTLYKENHYVGAWMQVRETLFNDSFAFVGDEATCAWADIKGVTAMAARLNRDLWQEWLLQDNAVVFWMEPSGGRLPKPIVLDVEICDYQATIGGETLAVKVPKRKLEPEEKASLSPRWIETYEKGKTLILDPDEGENFKVLKRSKTGDGFAMPRLFRAYRLLRNLGMLSTADSSGAAHHQDVARVISAGRDMKFADALKAPKYFTLEKKEKEVMEKAMKNLKGAFKIIMDAKVKMTWEHMDPKFFDAAKYKGTMDQLNLWGGPGMALLATGQQWLVPFFAAEGRGDRRDMALFLNELFADRTFLKMKPPLPLKVGWNPDSFKDAATVLQTVQFAVGQGIISMQTAREEFGLDDKREGDRLEAEAKKPTRYRPNFEPKQGMLSGPNGRPTDPKPGDGGA